MTHFEKAKMNIELSEAIAKIYTEAEEKVKSLINLYKQEEANNVCLVDDPRHVIIKS